MRETFEIYDDAIRAVGAKRLAAALGYSLAHTYRIAQPTVAQDADGNGASNPLDRLEALANLLAAYPGGRPVLEELRLWSDALFARVLRVSRGAPLTESSLLGHAASVMREVSELVANADPRTLDRERRARLRREAVDVLAVVQALVADIDAEEEQDGQDRQAPRMRAAG